jgi:Class III cytochrome C family/Cytochrome c7 and related cytochrome c
VPAGARARGAAVAAVVALGAGFASAQSFEKLVMPGPVAQAHAKIEGECGKCHVAFKSSAQTQLCLDCHKDVAADVRAKTGFHGRAPAVAGADCKTCHTEHEGRGADIVGLNRDAFRHELTDYPLHGAHVHLACERCHAAKEKFRDARSRCADCHSRDDAHKGRLGTDCAHCHEETAWRKAEFDHAKTRFPLEGKHADAACAACHAGERYKDTPRDCATCHVLDDAHKGRFGAKCETCHAASGWKTVRFDHARDTHFALTGAHQKTSCISCHTGQLYQQKLGTDCLSCHREDDVHKGNNGARCADCHQTTAWKPARFDHDRNTDFPLHGAHAKVACEACHTAPVHEQKLGRECADCHGKSDPHRGQLGKDCARCHGENSWREKVKFDHDLARFPLLGMHAVVGCEECHTSRAFRDTERSCVGCHSKRDVHEGKLGPSCEVCHTPNGWKLWKFDHTTQTSFPLRGAHEPLDCERCHRTALDGGSSLPTSCSPCHAADDAHRGAFGTNCAKCHGEKSWKDLKIVR